MRINGRTLMSDEHNTAILPVCIEIFKRLEEKVDTLIVKADSIHNRFEEVSELRTKIVAHDAKFVQLDVHRCWVIGLQVSVILIICIQVGTFLFMWGSMSNQVKVDVGRINSLEEIHPRLLHGNIGGEK
jgi:hypothetical protein